MSNTINKLTDVEKKQLVKLNKAAGVVLDTAKLYVKDVSNAKLTISDEPIDGTITSITHIGLDVNNNHRVMVRYRGLGCPFWNINTQALDATRVVIIPSLIKFLNRLGVMVVIPGEADVSANEILSSISITAMEQILTQIERSECDVVSYISDGRIINDLRPYPNAEIAKSIRALILEFADL